MSFLKELSLALGLLTSDHTPIADADGWQGFVWRVITIETCKDVDERGFCSGVRDKWDWKRDQQYSLSYRFSDVAGQAKIRLKLVNNDPADSDNVCIVAVFLDAQDQELAVFYQNSRSLHGRTIDREFPVFPPSPLQQIAKIAVGSKQCAKVNRSDNAAYRALRQRLASRMQ